MKKTALVVLMAVLITPPCFAQERDSIESTIWEVLPIGLQIFPFPWTWNPDDLEFGFYGGKVYMQDISPIENTSYKDMLEFIVFSGVNDSIPTQIIGGGSEPFFFFGILQPTGMGIVLVGYASVFPPSLSINMGLLIKTEGLFVPPRDPATRDPLEGIWQPIEEPDVRMTVRYSHLSPEHLQNAVNTLDSVIRQDGSKGLGQEVK